MVEKNPKEPDPAPSPAEALASPVASPPQEEPTALPATDPMAEPGVPVRPPWTWGPRPDMMVGKADTSIGSTSPQSTEED
jgi:hypothetical protein